jgi:nucleotide-binding universal stress UspA family protein
MDESASLGIGRVAIVGDAASAGSSSRTAGREHAPGEVRGAPDEITVLILATDLSAVSAGATDAAIGLAIKHRATLIVLSVVDPNGLRLPGGRFLRRIDQERSLVEAGAQAIVRRARSAGARATFLVWEGDPAESILQASESERADVIVLGSHDRGRLGRLVLGSVSGRVAANARCGVLVVPPDPSFAAGSAGA